MNRIYKTVFNRTLGLCQVVSELAKGHSRSGRARRPVDRRILPVLILALGSPGAVWATALPEGGTLVQGSAQISLPDGRTLTIEQHSHKAILNWESFSIGSGNTVNFQQPDASAVALNRVIGNDPSAIYGNLNANGQVFLVNTNGVLFAEGANVNVGGLVASTLNIRDQDFLNGHYTFEGINPGSVINRGTITADGGAVALLGGHVSNQGIIHANLGSVALAAGEKITLDFAGDGLINLSIDKGQLDALVENHGAIQADGGSVFLTTHAAGELLNSVVNNTGIVRAQTVEQREGKIILLADMQNGTARVGGTLDVSAPTEGNGGFLETSGAYIHFEEDHSINIRAAAGQGGHYLIDPVDFFIVEDGNYDAANANHVSASNLVDMLQQGGTIQIDTAQGNQAGNVGDITVVADLEYTSGHLVLTAHRDIHIDGDLTGATLSLHAGNNISASGDINVENFYLEAGHWRQFGLSLPTFYARDFYIASGASFMRSLDIAGPQYDGILSGTTTVKPHLLVDVYGLQGMRDFLTLHFALANDIDASGTANWNGGGFTPIGTQGGEALAFSGTLNGRHHVIRGLTIEGSQSAVGLFGVARNAYIQNIGLVDVDIRATGQTSDAGGLVGYLQGSTIENSFVSGSITGADQAGAIAGYVLGVPVAPARIFNSYAVARVTDAEGTGKLVGMREGSDFSAHGIFFLNPDTGARIDPFTGSALGPASFSADSYSGFDFNTVWGNAGNQTTPYLRGFSGNQVMVKDRGTDLYTVIQDVNQLQAVNHNLSGRYVLGNHIDASATAGWNFNGTDYLGFNPIGDNSTDNNATRFTGTFDGLGHVIRDLVINRPTTDYVGLFGYTDGATIRHIGLEGGEINGRFYVGGLVGYQFGGSIETAYATGAVSGDLIVGGLVGYQFGGSIETAYATGAVSGDLLVGGLVGYQDGGSIESAYATGAVNGTSDVGGLVGAQFGSITNSYWNTQTSGQENGVGSDSGSSSGVNGLTTAQMFQRTNLVGFDFDTVWGIVEGESYSYFLWQYPASGGAPQVLSGTLYEDATATLAAAGTALALYLNNTSLALTTGANGYFYQLLAPGTLDNSTLLIRAEDYGSSQAVQSLFFGAGRSGTSAQALTLAGDTLSVTLSGAAADNYGSYSTLLAAPDLSAALSGGLRGDLTNLRLTTSGHFTFDQALALDSLTLNGSSGQTLTATEDLHLGRFWLASGDWQQNSANLPAFSVDDFGMAVDQASFLRVSAGDGSADSPYRITDLYGLQGMASYGLLSRHFVLGNSINASATENWNNGAGFKPIGDNSTDTNATRFTGTFDGLGHVIRDLMMHRTDHIDVGLFGRIGAGSVIRNLGLERVDITGIEGSDTTVGGLVGYQEAGLIEQVYVTGRVHGQALNGSSSVGGLVGMQASGSIIGSYTAVDVEGVAGNMTSIGGLVGWSLGVIENVYATGTVTSRLSGWGGAFVGGLVGIQAEGSITQAYVTNEILSLGSGLFGSTNGRLVGWHVDGDIARTFYATTNTAGDDVNLGMEGIGDASGSMDVIGKTLDELKDYQTFAAWGDAISDQSGSVWRIYDGYTTPLLRAFLTPLTVTLAVAETTYNGFNQTASGSFTLSDPNAQISGSGTLTGSGRNAGAYQVYADLFSDSQHGYDLIYTDNTLTINKATLVLSAATDSRTYNGSTASSAEAIRTGLVGGDSISQLQQVFDSRHAGARTLSIVDGYVIDDGNGGNNYNVILETATGRIEQATLEITSSDVSRVYDGTTQAASEAVVASGQLFGDDEISGGEFAFLNRNAGDRKTVTVTNVQINDGNNGNNYAVIYRDNTTSNITPKHITAQVSADNKRYDGSTHVTLRGLLDGVIGNDDVALMLSGWFGTADVGADKMVLLNTALEGTDAGNYLLNAPTSVTASIIHHALPVGYEDALVSAVQAPHTGSRAQTQTHLALNAAAGDITLVLDISTDTLNVSAWLPEAALTQEQLAEHYLHVQEMAELERQQITLAALLPEAGSVLFPVNSVRIEDEEGVRQLLAAMVAFLQNNPNVRVQLVGHADQTGPERFNRQLSEQRAQSVAQLLGNWGVSEQQIDIVGVGSEQPLREGNNREALASNRRVDFSLP